MEYSRVRSCVLSPERSLPEQRVAIESGGAATIFKRIFLYLKTLDEDPKRANLKLHCHAKLLSEINLQMLISSLSSGAIKTVNDAKRMIG